MNYHNLTEIETKYLFFAMKKVLRDRDILPPDMVQYYQSCYESLSLKLRRLRDGTPQDETRHRFAKVRPSWYDVAVGKVPPDPSADSGKVGDD